MNSESTEIVDDIMEIVINSHTGGDKITFQAEAPVTKNDINNDNLASQIVPPEVKIEDMML